MRVFWLWRRTKLSAIFRETRGWGRGEGSPDLLIQALAGLIHIWIGLELRPKSQPHGWCWH